MGLTWKDASEIITGLVINNRLPLEYVPIQYVKKPYRDMLTLLDKGGKKEELLARYYHESNTAMKASETIVEVDIENIIRLLTSTYERELKKRILEEQIARLEGGEDIDYEKLQSLMEVGFTTEYETLYDIMINREPHAFRKFYWDVIDNYIGDRDDETLRGIPESGLVIVAGSPSSGKTSLVTSMITRLARKGKKTLFYSLEMTSEQAGRRLLQTSISALTENQMKNIIISDKQMTALQIYTEAMRICAIEDIHSIYIDFADYLAQGKEDEPEVAYTYMTMAKLAKYNKSKAPVILLSQLNRRYTEGYPTINQIRWSGLAESLASVIYLVYNPTATVHTKQGKNDQLPSIHGHAYLIIGKSRFGYVKGSKGAIQVEFDGRTGWGKAQSWIPIT